MDLRRGINSAVEKVLSYLKKHAKMISTTEEIAQVRRLPPSSGTACKGLGSCLSCHHFTLLLRRYSTTHLAFP